jgi:sugar lactone lactonase YvrE
MKYSRVLPTLFTIVATVLLTIAALAAPVRLKTAPHVPITRPKHIDHSQFFPESDLRLGQTGYALTVFSGTKIQRFGVEILGVLHKINNGRDWILIKVTSGPSVTDNLNIAEGMSGSPVYIDGKLVGAIAASIPFGRSPMGFVTPIHDMLEAWDPDLPSKPNINLSALVPSGSASTPVDVSVLKPLIGSADTSLLPQGSQISIRPLETPVMVSGMGSAGIARLQSVLAPFGMIPMAGGGMSGPTKTSTGQSSSLVPGAAVGFSLVQGDMDMTAIGTVTYRNGNRLIAFGHPFTDFGAIDAPLTTANIVGLIPSYQTSTKLGEPIANVGRVFQDRPFSIGGEIGVAPHMVPVTISVVDNTNKRHRTYHFQIIDHPLLTGSLVLNVAQQAILETHGTPGDAVATVTTTVSADQVGRITRSNVFYDSLGIEQSATADLDSLIRLLTSNSFYPLSINGVDMQVSISSSHATAQVDHIFVPKTKYQPGDTVKIGIVIKPYKQAPVLKTVLLKIPSSTADGNVTLQVRGGGVAEGQTISLGGTTIVVRSPTSAGPTPANVNQLVRQYLDQPKNNDLVAVLQLPTTAVAVQGEDLSLLPPTMSTVMRSARSTGVHTARDEVKQIVPTAYVLTGSQSLTLTVAKSDEVDKSVSASTPEPGTDTAVGDVTTTTDDSTSTDTGDGDSSSDDSSAMLSGVASDAATFKPTSATKAVPKHTVTVNSLPLPPQTPDSDDSLPPPPPPDGSDAPPPVRRKVVGRQAQIWRQDSLQGFALGKLNNATITSSNELRLSLSLKPLADSTSSYIWCLAQDKSGTLYAGTGDDGIVYKVDQNGNMTPYSRTGELEVTALAYDSGSGHLYAGTSPHGAIFDIGPDGKGNKVGTVGDKYVTSLAIDDVRSLMYIATGGGSGDIYTFSLRQKIAPKQFFVSPETHLLSVAVDVAGTIYAGGSPDGVIYSITPGGVAKVIYESAQPNITALAVDGSGTVYAGTSPEGIIYKITPNSSANFGADVKVLSARPKSGISSLDVDAVGNVWASAGDSIYYVDSDDTTYTYAAPSDVTLLSLLVGQDGSVYAGTGNTASIYRLGIVPNDKSAYDGDYTSPVHDALRPSQWGTITWNAISPSGTSLVLQTRTGDVSKPDQTWSDWSTNFTTPSGQTITSPPARYIQYRVLFSSTNPEVRSSAMPRLTSVSIYYLTRDQPPIVSVTAPVSGDFLSGTSTLHWSAIDPDHDTLSYDLYYSADGKNYLPLPRNPTTIGPATPDQVSQLKQDLDKHPEIPLAVRTQMLQQATAGSAAGASANHVTSNSLDWNTRSVPDGQYKIKVIASDYQSNPVDSRTGEGYSQPFLIVNTPPTLTLTASATVINPDKTISLQGIASSKLAFVTAVQYQVDKSKDLYSAAPDQGIFDSTTAPFTIHTLPLSSGPHTLTVTALDEANNASSVSTLVVVP